MRRLPRILSFVAVALAGVARAQPFGVVDPWERTNGDAGAQQPARTRLAGIELEDPWSTASELPTSPAAAPPTRIETTPVIATTARFTLKVDVGVIDPWTLPIGASEARSLKRDTAHAAVDRSPSTHSVVRSNEIVDPWIHPLEQAATRPMSLVLDPWAR